MSAYQCRMCGGPLPLTAEPVVTCEYCGSLQPFHSVDSEKVQQLFNRANRLRLDCEFDRAAAVYESIAAECPGEPEASWGMVLCRYGIEYVDDPATGKKVPTCHRSSYASIWDDADCQRTLDCAGPLARKLYHREAARIEELREGILEVSAREDPYDIFICYKETDDRKNRTLDSVLAQDIYDLLTDKGYRVFFSRISLEDKLGREYEPCIFAALNSAKVMLAVGTCFEHYDAVWVKNEWSRFLKLMEKDREKYLIPCYKDLDAYDMPREFRRLQAQDLGKVGAHQDLLRGIEKLLPRSKASAMGDAESLLKRAFLFLEDENWSSADEYCEKVLDIDPGCADAYLGKLMAQLRVKTPDALRSCAEPFDDSYNYKKAVRFGDGRLREMLEGCTRYIKDRIEQEKIALQKREEEERKRAEEECIARGQREEQERIARIERLSPHRERIVGLQKMISANDHTVALKVDGTVVTVGCRYAGQDNVSRWEEIAAVSAGGYHNVGLKADGTVVAVGFNDKGQCNVSKWTDIIAISAGNEYTTGLKADGTVVATQYIPNRNNKCDKYRGQCNVSQWTNIAAISAGEHHTVGLKADGTVVAVGGNYSNECDVSLWTDIVAISACWYHTAGLKADGTVVDTSEECDVSGWNDIVAISAGYHHTVGLKADGTVVATKYIGLPDNYHGQCDVSEWKDIVAVSAGVWHTVGLKADGTVVATKYTGKYDRGQCDVDGWRLFQSIDTIEEEKADALKKREEAKALALKKQQEEAERQRRRTAGLCQHCGGRFGGFLTKKCSNCGIKKDY